LGQKINTNRQQIGHNKNMGKQMVRKKRVCARLIEDLKLRNTLKDKLYHAGISRIEIERVGEKVRVLIYAARPGIIIGKKGAEVDKLKKLCDYLISINKDEYISTAKKYLQIIYEKTAPT